MAKKPVSLSSLKKKPLARKETEAQKVDRQIAEQSIPRPSSSDDFDGFVEEQDRTIHVVRGRPLLKQKPPTKQDIDKLRRSRGMDKAMLGLQKPTTFLLFVHWIGTAEALRVPKTQKEFADKYKVSYDTLSLWKMRPNFWELVQKSVRATYQEKLGTAVNALLRRLDRRGEAKEFKEFYAFLKDMRPEDDKDNPVIPVDSQQLAHAMVSAGLAGATEAHERMAREFAAMREAEGDGETDDEYGD